MESMAGRDGGKAGGQERGLEVLGKWMLGDEDLRLRQQSDSWKYRLLFAGVGHQRSRS